MFVVAYGFHIPTVWCGQQEPISQVGGLSVVSVPVFLLPIPLPFVFLRFYSIFVIPRILFATFNFSQPMFLQIV